MQAYFFGAAERRLFAAYHPALTPNPPGQAPAVLICGPHGQEAVRAHRLMRVASERLARAGCEVLRFDPYGSGDAAGADEELELDGWQADLQAAAAELKRRSPDRPQVWLGFRLGATVACRAARVSAGGPAPVALVLVEPVLDGAQYLRGLAEATVRVLEFSSSIKNPDWRNALRHQPDVLEREAVGFALGPKLHGQLQNLRQTSADVPAIGRVAVLVPQGDTQQQSQVESWCGLSRNVNLDAVPYTFDWTAEEALNSAWVPPELVSYLVTQSLERMSPPAGAAP